MRPPCLACFHHSQLATPQNNDMVTEIPIQGAGALLATESPGTHSPPIAQRLGYI